MYPLGPTVVPTPREWIDTDSGKTATQTWSLTDIELTEILEFAWDSLNPDSEEIISNVELLPVVSKSSMPYCNQLGIYLLLLNSLNLIQIPFAAEKCLLVPNIPVHLTVKKFEGHETVECYFCTTKTKLKDMRNHVGRHILCAFRDVEDTLSLKEGMWIGVNPCGWCGREGCKVQLSSNNNISSSCSYHYTKMMYAKAAQYSKTSPCTNVPIHCPICPEGFSGQPRTIWKYNALAHFAAEHVPMESDELPDIPSHFIVETFITSKEEKDMGISQEATQDYRDTYQIPGTDGIEEMKKRGRADSAVSTISTQPPTKSVRS